MSLWSDREESLKEKEADDELKRIGHLLRSFPSNELDDKMNLLKKAGINVEKAMHLTARNHWDKWW